MSDDWTDEIVNRVAAGMVAKGGLTNAAARARVATFIHRARKQAVVERGDDGGGTTDHHASKVADLLVEAGRFPHRAAALHHLLHSSGGQALLSRMHKAAEPEKEILSMSESLQSIAKDRGIVAVAKAIVSEQRSFGIGEEQFTKLMTEEASRRWPDMRPDAAFSKLFCDAGPDGVVLRKAHALTKGGVYDIVNIEPMMVGTPGAMHEAVDNTSQSEAYAQLEAMAARLRGTSPWLSAEQAFARVIEDPKHSKIAAKAHRRPSATTSFPFPR